jgi:hypothetical protein
MACILIATNFPGSSAFALSATKTHAQSQKSAKPTRYKVLQKIDRRGGVVEQIITGDNFSELIVDSKANGEHDLWEISRPANGTTFRALYPRDGRYSQIEVDQKRSGGTLLLTFVYQYSTRDYLMTSAKFAHDVHLQGESIVYDNLLDANGKHVPTCDLKADGGNFQSAGQWLQTLNQLNERSLLDKQDMLQCYITRYQESFFDQACFKNYASSLDDMKAGIADVLKSAFSTAKPKTYLQCLSEQGFSTHTARMESTIQKLTADIEGLRHEDRELQAALAEKDPAKRSEMLKAVCQQPYRSYSIPQHRSAPPVSCLHSDTPEIADYYRPLDQITFAKTSDELKKIAQSPKTNLLNRTPRQIYGSYFFHEMLHQSSIDNETLTYALQNCCDGSAKNGVGDCKKAQDIGRDNGMVARYDNNFSLAFPSYPDARRRIQNEFIPTNTALQNAYFTGFDSHKKDAEAAYKTCTAGGGNSCNAACTEKCSQGYLNEMAKFSKDFFNDPNYCAAAARLASPPPSANACAELGQSFYKMISEAKFPASDSVASSATGAHVLLSANGGGARTTERGNFLPAEGSIDVLDGKNAVPPSTSLAGQGTMPSGNNGSATAGNTGNNGAAPAIGGVQNSPGYPAIVNLGGGAGGGASTGSSGGRRSGVQLGSGYGRTSDGIQVGNSTRLADGFTRFAGQIGDGLISTAYGRTSTRRNNGIAGTGTVDDPYRVEPIGTGQEKIHLPADLKIAGLNLSGLLQEGNGTSSATNASGAVGSSADPSSSVGAGFGRRATEQGAGSSAADLAAGRVGTGARAAGSRGAVDGTSGSLAAGASNGRGVARVTGSADPRSRSLANDSGQSSTDSALRAQPWNIDFTTMDKQRLEQYLSSDYRSKVAPLVAASAPVTTALLQARINFSRALKNNNLAVVDASGTLHGYGVVRNQYVYCVSAQGLIESRQRCQP